MTKQHLTPDQVGKLALAAGVKGVVLTHNALRENGADGAKAAIALTYSGSVAVAHDLDRF
jgi:ribonuclease BN (tRNA processing enzyme)